MMVKDLTPVPSTLSGTRPNGDGCLLAKVNAFPLVSLRDFVRELQSMGGAPLSSLGLIRVKRSKQVHEVIDMYPNSILLKLVRLIEYSGTRVLKALPLFFLCLLAFGCNTMSRGLVVPGGDNVVVIQNFWFNWRDGGGSSGDQDPSINDPIGGQLFLYWIDEAGNVCHGQPGVSGQPGPTVFPAYHEDAILLARENSVITTDQMRSFQTIPYDIDGYITRYHASTLHFVQYGNGIWRSRDDGSTFVDASTIIFSVPLVISVETTNAIYPYHPGDRSDCSLHDRLPAPSPVVPPLGTPTEPGQDPEMCRRLAMPTSSSMSYSESMNYCLANLLH